MKFCPIVLAILFSVQLSALNVTIIESQSIAIGLDMDYEWMQVVESMGHSAIIVPKLSLNSDTNFLITDILIVSSGDGYLSDLHVNTILKLITQGVPVYLQTEHLAGFSHNKAFRTLIDSLGGTFEWKAEFSGWLENINVLGNFQNAYTDVDLVDQFWYSVSGEGDCRTIHFLEYQNSFHGFQYIPINNLYGSLVTTADQDWIRETLNPELMKNILANMINPEKIVDSNFSLSVGNDTTLCKGDTLVLNLSLPNANYYWSNGSTSESISLFESGHYEVEVSHYCGIGADEINVNFIMPPDVSICCDYILCKGTSISLDATTINGSYLWNVGSIDPDIDVYEPGTYWVEVSNECGMDSFFTNIIAKECDCSVYVPNIFTPNGDGNNDYFGVLSNCNLNDFTLTIFDRWGNMVFESKDSQVQWDGFLMGKQQPVDVYVYSLSYRYNMEPLVYQTGDIALLR